jgi:uncharacterized phage protein (TIGR01671 family)
MREIKFRYWSMGPHIRMVYFTLDELYSSTSKHEEQTGIGEMKSVVEITEKNGLAGSEQLMQYTGLKDKNGKEIYEGDIIQEGSGPCGDTRGVVENVNGDTVVRFLPGSIPDDWNHEYYPVFGLMDHSEIIGNIYENPELLEGNHEEKV